MTPLFGPGWGNYAIQGIVEISEPGPVSLLPQTPGWYVLAALLLALAGYAAWRRLQRWRHNRYRREALAEITALRARIRDGDLGAARELAPLLKATALAVGRREALAACGEDRWAAQLAAMAPGLPPLPTVELHRLAYAPLGDTRTAELEPLLDAVEHWISRHRGPDD